jgi:acyl-CoA thioester hydrolase
MAACQIGHQQADLLRDPGIAFVVRSVSIEYLKPARLDDQLIVGLEVEKISRAQIFFRQHIRRADENGERADGRNWSAPPSTSFVSTRR